MGTMAHGELEDRLQREAATVGRRLRQHFASRPSPARRLDAAMEYSLLGGGKRLRPVLCLWAYDALQPHRCDAVWRGALALEMLHSYSLIHDDLPAMDDDDLRRGQPSCHRKFDEATAILAGDTLQTEAFALLAQAAPAELAMIMVRILAEAAGRHGMAGGQQLDLDAESRALEKVAVLEIHRRKTGALLGASLAVGAACGGLREAELDKTREAGVELGIAFQIVDDLLDESATAEELGKSPGKDQAQNKLTATRVMGVDLARQEAQERSERGREALRELGLWTAPLDALSLFLLRRQR